MLSICRVLMYIIVRKRMNQTSNTHVRTPQFSNPHLKPSKSNRLKPCLRGVLDSQTMLLSKSGRSTSAESQNSPRTPTQESCISLARHSIDPQDFCTSQQIKMCMISRVPNMCSLRLQSRRTGMYSDQRSILQRSSLSPSLRTRSSVITRTSQHWYACAHVPRRSMILKHLP